VPAIIGNGPVNAGSHNCARRGWPAAPRARTITVSLRQRKRPRPRPARTGYHRRPPRSAPCRASRQPAPGCCHVAGLRRQVPHDRRCHGCRRARHDQVAAVQQRGHDLRPIPPGWGTNAIPSRSHPSSAAAALIVGRPTIVHHEPACEEPASSGVAPTTVTVDPRRSPRPGSSSRATVHIARSASSHPTRSQKLLT
jgi:hypothetical protein